MKERTPKSRAGSWPWHLFTAAVVCAVTVWPPSDSPGQVLPAPKVIKMPGGTVRDSAYYYQINSNNNWKQIIKRQKTRP